MISIRICRALRKINAYWYCKQHSVYGVVMAKQSTSDYSFPLKTETQLRYTVTVYYSFIPSFIHSYHLLSLTLRMKGEEVQYFGMYHKRRVVNHRRELSKIMNRIAQRIRALWLARDARVFSAVLRLESEAALKSRVKFVTVTTFSCLKGSMRFKENPLPDSWIPR